MSRYEPSHTFAPSPARACLQRTFGDGYAREFLGYRKFSMQAEKMLPCQRATGDARL